MIISSVSLCQVPISAENFSAATNVFNVSIVEAASATDIVSATASFSASLTEAASAADIVSALAVFAASLSEANNATDTEATGQTGSIVEPCNGQDHVDCAQNKAQFQPLPPIRDWWDRDDWGRFIPGGGIRRN